MGITIPSKIADYRGQCIESVEVTGDALYIHCRRDKRFAMGGDRSGWRGLCRYMPISAVARYVGLRWNTVKSIDRAWIEKSLPMQSGR